MNSLAGHRRWCMPTTQVSGRIRKNAVPWETEDNFDDAQFETDDHVENNLDVHVLTKQESILRSSFQFTSQLKDGCVLSVLLSSSAYYSV